MFRQRKTRNRCAWWTFSFIAVAILSCALLGGESGPDDAKTPAREQLLMLSTGRILSGQVTRNAGGYLIEQPSGRIQISADEVSFVADDLRGLYRKQRDSIVHPTPSSHLSLASWCVSHRLHNEARDELKLCLKLDPENDEARRLLQRMTDTVRAGLPPSTVGPGARKTFDGFIQPDVESLGGLSRESAVQFTSKVQPLLLNKCGNASCHGTTSSNGFRLVSARVNGNGSRQNSERNLSETMRYVDLEDVANSELLSVATTAHGGRGTIFVGPAGNEQMKLLRNWARVVAEEKRAISEELETRSAFGSNGKRKNAKVRETDSAFAKKKPAGFASRDARGDTFESNATDRPEPDLAETEMTSELKPYDTFDPEIFNRQPRRR